jgi:hypothetical protein
MSLFRSLSATLLSAVVSFSLVTGSGCGTGAVGIDDCRDIEQARCRGGKPCGIAKDVDACERYYRDHCLHGLAMAPPAGASVAACINVIETAGECAKADPETPLGECNDGSIATGFRLNTVCDVVLHPERAAECAFLTNVPPEEGGGGTGGGDEDEEAPVAGQAGTPSDSGQAGTPAE